MVPYLLRIQAIILLVQVCNIGTPWGSGDFYISWFSTLIFVSSAHHWTLLFDPSSCYPMTWQTSIALDPRLYPKLSTILEPPPPGTQEGSLVRNDVRPFSDIQLGGFNLCEHYSVTLLHNCTVTSSIWFRLTLCNLSHTTSIGRKPQEGIHCQDQSSKIAWNYFTKLADRPLIRPTWHDLVQPTTIIPSAWYSLVLIRYSRGDLPRSQILQRPLSFCIVSGKYCGRVK